MTLREIVATIGREQRVERIVCRIAGRDTLTADLEDLAQMVYLILLEYPEDKIQDLWDCDAIYFLIVRLVIHNLRSKTSRYYYAIKVFQQRTTDLAGLEFKTEE